MGTTNMKAKTLNMGITYWRVTAIQSLEVDGTVIPLSEMH